MSEKNLPSALPTNYTDEGYARFEADWLAWKSGDPPPRWQDYLPAADARYTVDLVMMILQVDIECRIKAGLPALLAERYFEHPRLQQEDARLNAEQQIELIQWEYEKRRENGQPAQRAEYEAAFPQHTDAVRQLKPHSRCPKCKQIIALDETYQTFGCPVCDATTSLGDSPAAPAELDLRGYQLVEKLGQGGMGAVYRSCDPSLSRDLAIKVITADAREHPVYVRRFLREARITGSLQHAGIVAVHNLGRLPDGRLHYTMRLVRGRTFADILKDEAGKPERLPYLLGIFEKICQAMAYAHSKRVLHRDLKPHNVMMGRFGEVQVMDWGLAKLLTSEEEEAEPEGTPDVAGTHIHTEPADTPLDLTRRGSGFGSPPYLPPEQALGEWKLVDERADVFALGSILCELLTGKPAYTGSTQEEVFWKAKRGDLGEALARLKQCGADAALTALCRECLAVKHQQRPRDASVVEKSVADYQAAVERRLRKAELERTEAEVKRREERKRRRLALLLSAAVVFVFIVGTLISTLFAVDARRQADAARKHAENAESEKLRADEKARQADAEKRLATQARDEAKLALQKVETAAEAERVANKLAQSRLNQIEKADEMLDSIFRELDPRSEEQGGPSLRQQMSRLIERTAAQLDEVAIYDPRRAAHLQSTLGRSLIAFGQPRQAEVLLRKALVTLWKELGRDHTDSLTALNYLASALQLSGKIAEAIRTHELHLERLEAKRGTDHPNTLQSRNNLALAYKTAGRFADAIRLFKINLKLAETKLGSDHPDTLQYRINLGSAYQHTANTNEAIRLYELTIKYNEAKYGTKNRHVFPFHDNLAVAYLQAGRTSDAIPLFEKGLKQRVNELGTNHMLTLNSRYNLAIAYSDADRKLEAIRLFKEVLEQYKAILGSDHPNTLATLTSLASAYRDVGQIKDSLALLKEAQKSTRRILGTKHPDTARISSSLADTYCLDGKFAEAEAFYREALKITRDWAGEDSLTTAAMMAKLAHNLLSLQKYTEAETRLRDCLKVREAKQPDDWTIGNTRSMLGEALLGQKKYIEAAPLLLQGYEWMKEREGKIPPQGKVRLIEALERLVRLYKATGKTDEAAKWQKELKARKQAGSSR